MEKQGIFIACKKKKKIIYQQLQNSHTSKTSHLPAGSTLVKGMNPVCSRPLLPLSHLPKRWYVTPLHTCCLFLIRADTEQRPLFFFIPPPAQTNYAWEKQGQGGSLSFYISIFAEEADRQAVWNVNVWLSSLWLMWDHSDGCTQRCNEHTHTNTHRLCRWVS